MLKLGFVICCLVCLTMMSACGSNRPPERRQVRSVNSDAFSKSLEQQIKR